MLIAIQNYKMFSGVPPKIVKKHLKRVSLCVCVCVIVISSVLYTFTTFSFFPLYCLHHIFYCPYRTCAYHIQIHVINNCNQQFTDRRKRDPEDYSKMSQIYEARFKMYEPKVSRLVVQCANWI